MRAYSVHSALIKTVWYVRRVLGIVQYYRDMWTRRSHTLSPLTDLVSTSECTIDSEKKNKLRKIKWSNECQKSFEAMKSVVDREVLLAYPIFDRSFEIYTEASSKQLGTVILQSDKPLSFFSRKLSNAQLKYTTRELELLSIVETLHEFRNTLFGY